MYYTKRKSVKMRVYKLSRFLILALLLSALTACQVSETPTAPPATATLLPFPTSIPLTEGPTLTPSPTLRPSATPLPSLTLAPSLTPIPTNTPTPGIIGIGFDTGPFRDDFSDPFSGWPVENGSDWGFGYESGGYVMYNNLPNAEVCASRTRSHTDFVIEVDVEKLSGPDSAYFGITCRKIGTNYYTLAITGNGEYNIWKTVGAERELLAEGVHPAINTGNDSNHLFATCIGNVLTLSVNGAEVVSVVDIGPLFGTFVGLILGTAGEPEAVVKFDNFNSYPAEGAAPLPTLTPTGTLTPGTPTSTPTATP